MAIQAPLTRKAVLAAISHFDRLGRESFLKKYDFGKATTYFLSRRGERYDAKAIVGAAYGFLPRGAPLAWHDFGSREVTTKRWLEELDFPVVERSGKGVEIPARASERLDVGALYTREQLKERFSIADATINNGVFRPDGYHSVWLFVTERKTPDRTQFRDFLHADTLRWQGQLSGRTDPLIVEHGSRNLELLLFYRREKYEYPKAAFRYEGIFHLEHKEGSHPTSFILARKSKRDPVDAAQDVADRSGAFDPNDAKDARRKINATIVSRRGQSRFRAALLRAYSGCCAITGCDYPEALEAAHISPYRGPLTNHVTNGLILRADIHTLFDLGWIAIDPESLTVILDPSLATTTYRNIEGKRLALPHRHVDRPSPKALEKHFRGAHAGKAYEKQRMNGRKKRRE